MINHSSISVIIPVYNGERYLSEAIRSVLSQSTAADEIWVVDDGSTDNSAALASAFPLPVRCLRQDHSGAAAARNHGVATARGEYLAFLDADDLWLPDKLERQLAAFVQNPALDITLGQVEQFVSPDLSEEERARLKPARPILDGYHAGGMLVRRTAFDRVGGFDPQWRVGEVIDWFARAREIGLKTVILPSVVMKRRIHAHNLMRQSVVHQVDYARLLKTALDRRRASIHNGDETS